MAKQNLLMCYKPAPGGNAAHMLKPKNKEKLNKNIFSWVRSKPILHILGWMYNVHMFKNICLYFPFEIVLKSKKKDFCKV